MSFRFLHTADWHVGRPFSGFPSHVAGLLTEARIAIVPRLAEAARHAGVEHVLVAGDVFDSEIVETSVVRPVLDGMAAAEHCTWHLLPGNHDPARAGGLWEALRAAGLPHNVMLRDQPEATEIAAGVWLLPAPVSARFSSGDPTAVLDQMATPEGAIRIGLAHGAVRDFQGGGNESMDGRSGSGGAVIAPDRARSAGLSYLALGDWHGTGSVTDRCWYAGTPEPDRFRANVSGEVLAVSIGGGTAMPAIERLPTGHYVWHARVAEITELDDGVRLAADLRQGVAEPRRTLLRLRVTGALGLADRAALEAGLGDAVAGILHAEIDLDDLAAVPDAQDRDTLRDDDVLLRAGELLEGLVRHAPDTPGVDPAFAAAWSPGDAERALKELHRLAREASA